MCSVRTLPARVEYFLKEGGTSNGADRLRRSHRVTRNLPRLRQESRTLLQPKIKSMLQGVLTCVVVPGRFCAADLTRQIAAGKVGNRLWKVDEDDDGPNRHTCRLRTYPRFATPDGDMQSHGVSHVTDSLSLLG